MGFSDGSVVKDLPAVQEMRVLSLYWEDLLEKEMATDWTAKRQSFFLLFFLFLNFTMLY